MIRGTTPTHLFTLPVDTSVVQSIRALYSQKDVLLLKIETSRFTLDGKTAKVKLTQEETLKFDDSVMVEVQVRILTTGGDALASEVMRAYVGQLLDDEVLT